MYESDLSGQTVYLSNALTSLTIIGLICSFCFITFIVNFAAADLSDQETKRTYGCEVASTGIHCDRVEIRFNSFYVMGNAKMIYQVTPTDFDSVKGHNGNALALKGYVQKFVTLANKPSLNNQLFSISFWMKQDPAFTSNSAVLSHINFTHTSGWSFERIWKPVDRLKFSVANTRGDLFTVQSPIHSGSFDHIVGTFDGRVVKIYLNGALMNSTRFYGEFQPDPGVPINIGQNSYDHDKAWMGIIDDLRMYARVLSIKEIQDISRDVHSPFEELVGYWPFDNGTKDYSSRYNDFREVVQVVSMAFAPDGRLFFTEKDTGEVRIIKDDKVLPEPFVRIPVKVTGHGGLLGIALDPDFAINHYVYLYYTAFDDKAKKIFDKVVRFTEVNNKATTERIIIPYIPGSSDGLHVGGAMTFGPDKKLYVSTGFASTLDLKQNKTNLLGKVLRINGDGTIPSDNPFPNSPVYTWGHRNVYGIAIDDKGVGIVTENGEAHYDEINVLSKGGNYGFPTTQNTNSAPTGDNSSNLKPVRFYYQTTAPAQAIYYDEDKFPSLKGKYLVAMFNTGSLHAISLDGTNKIKEEMIIKFPSFYDNIIAVAQSPTGDVYFGADNIYKLDSIDQNHFYPQINWVDLTLKDAKLNNIEFEPNNKTISLSIGTDRIGETIAPPYVNISLPISLFGSALDLKSYSETTGQEGGLVKQFKITHQSRTSHPDETTVFVELNPNNRGQISIIGSH
jgi:glucose/arabinose dehydrogenase